MKKILEGLFIIGFLFIGTLVQAVGITTGTNNPTTTSTSPTSTTTSSTTDLKVCCASFGYGSNMVKTFNSYKLVTKNECVYPTGLVGGGMEIVSNNLCTSNVTPPPTVKGCLVGFNYNPETGVKCLAVPINNGCFPGFIFSSTTGQKCSIGSSFKVLSPNGGEVYKVGDVMNIKWNGCDQYKKLSLFLTDPKLTGPVTELNLARNVACSSNSSSNSYSYKVPSSIFGYGIATNIGGNTYKLWINDGTVGGTSGQAISDNYFTINNPNSSNAYGTNSCPVIATPDPITFCPKGTIESVKDANNVCVTSYKCVPPPATSVGFIAKLTGLISQITNYFFK